MTDFSSLLGGVMTFASLMAGVSIAVERVVEMIKGAVPLLNNPWQKNDQVRAAILQLIAAAAGAVVVSQMPGQIKNAMPAQISVPLNWTTYAVLGLISSGGAGAWNHVLDILGALKTKQETLASLVQATGSAPAAALATPTATTVVAAPSAAAAAQGVSSSAAAPLASATAAGIGFVGALSAPVATVGRAESRTLPAAAPREAVSTGSSAGVSPLSPSAPGPAQAEAPLAVSGAAPVMDATRTAARIYPGRVVSTGDEDHQVVTLVQHRLNQVGCGPVSEDGVFGQQTKEAVELYQIRSADHYGLPLTVDGVVGPLTWYSLFAMPPVPGAWHSSFTPSAPSTNIAMSPLLATTLNFAAGEIGVMEDPLGSNRGPRVDQYLRSVGIDPTTGSFPWCAAFVYFCFQQAASQLGVKNPVIKTDGVLDHWNRAGLANIKRLDAQTCVATPSLVGPGMIFVIIHPSGTTGHTGLVEKVEGNLLTTIEGNTNINGSREGIGVFRRNQRTIASINRGFIVY